LLTYALKKRQHWRTQYFAVVRVGAKGGLATAIDIAR
jgi:hypothetical protein